MIRRSGNVASLHSGCQTMLVMLVVRKSWRASTRTTEGEAISTSLASASGSWFNASSSSMYALCAG